MAQIVPIIGGGPAGMSCALWLGNYGLHPIIIEKESALGGMARRDPYPNPWLLGRPGALARENADEFARHIRQAGADTWLSARPQLMSRKPDGNFALEVAFSDGRPPQSLSSQALVIATGTEFRGEDWLDRVPDARRLAAQGLVHVGPVAIGEPGAEVGSHVAIIGGGDNAFDVAQILLGRGIKVTIVLRSAVPHAQPRLVEHVRAHVAGGRACIIAGRSVTALAEVGRTVRLRLDDGTSFDADHVVLLFGYQPNSGEPWLAPLALERDAGGYLMVDGNMETSCRGVFAVGDVANPVHPCIATALATGTMAAREIQKRLA